MNDRFRFRAWSKQLERMVCIDEMLLFHLAEVDSDLVFEQCTGIKDKNGKLIYEGDIVESYGELWKCVFEMNHGYGIDSPGFVLKNNFGHAQPFRNIQVVGNIHENPELLEVEK